MAERRPLVRSSGALAEMPAGDTLPLTVLPSGTGPSNKGVVASENLAANDLVNLWDDSGTLKARKADADGAKPAHGYVKDGFSSAATATVFFEGEISGLTSKTPGARQFVSATAGEMAETAPTGNGVISQCVGIATSATTVQFLLEPPVLLADLS